MKVQCVLCEIIEEKDPNSFIGKRLRNRPGTTYMCATCSERIRVNTEYKKTTGKRNSPIFYKEKEAW